MNNTLTAEAQPASGFYKTPELQARPHASYDRTLAFWPVAYEEAWMETAFGRSHFIISGSENAPAVILIPGLFADATMWYANVGPLAEHYRVYCPDMITYGGKSEPGGQQVETIEDYRTWFRQILDHFGHDQVTVGGLSYGSWLALALAREMPETIEAVIMLDPSETFVKMDGGIAWKGFWNFVFFPSRTKYTRFMNWLSGGYSDPQCDVWGEHMIDVIEYGSVGMFDIPQHRIYHREDLEKVTMPVLVVAGGKPIVYKDPHELAAAARTALPQAQVEIVPDTGHSLNVEKADEVNAIMLQFLQTARSQEPSTP